MSADQAPSGGCQNCGGPVRTRKGHGWVCSACDKELDRQAEQLRLTASHWRQAREVERDLAAETYAAIVAAVDSGMSEVQAAKVASVDRMTVRRALGKL
jgi:reverse gyrase